MDSLDLRLADLRDELAFQGDWTDRYRLMVEWGETLTPLAEGDRLPSWIVEGCSSPLWLRVRRTETGLEVRGASPGVLPRALVALVCRLFDGLTETPDPLPPIIETLELNRNLSPTRVMVLQQMLDRVVRIARSRV